jgi:hypothetical protein
MKVLLHQFKKKKNYKKRLNSTPPQQQVLWRKKAQKVQQQQNHREEAPRSQSRKSSDKHQRDPKGVWPNLSRRSNEQQDKSVIE